MKMNPTFAIVYVGALWEGSTCIQRMQACKDLGHKVFPIDTHPKIVLKKQQRFWYRGIGKLYRMGFNGFGPVDFGPLDLAQVNVQLIEAIKKYNSDILWIDKGITIKKETLQQIKKRHPQCKIVGYSPDDMAARHNQSRYFKQTLPFYDIFFTTKSYNVKELEALGCPQVKFVANAFDVHTHKPMRLSSEMRHNMGGPVGFIGSWEKERSQSVLHLAKAGIPVTLWGDRWKEKMPTHPNTIIRGPSQYGSEFARIICSFDINLGYLRKINRDLQTTRSVEIPACGAFMLAERTDEHLALFEEGKEAEFFSSDDELLDKVKYYLAHPEERKRIAAAGRERCLKSGYSNQDRLKVMLDIVNSL